MRETRDLLRRRTYLVRKRAELMTHLQILNAQYNLAPFPKKLSFAANRAEMNVAQRFTDASVQKSAAADLALIDALDTQIGDLELYLVRTAKVDDVQTFHRLRSIPGVGKMLALILLYEMHDVPRFAGAGQFLSYARLVRCADESAGKKLGSGGKKIGNAHLRWAFAEAACLFLRSSERAKTWKQRVAAQRGEGKALAILAARLGARSTTCCARAWRSTRRGSGTTGRSRAKRVPLPCPARRRCRMPRIDFAAARRSCDWPTCWRSGRLHADQPSRPATARPVSGASLAAAGEPLVRGPSGQGRLALLRLRRRRQCVGPLGGVDRRAGVRGGCRSVCAAGPGGAAAGAASRAVTGGATMPAP